MEERGPEDERQSSKTIFLIILFNKKIRNLRAFNYINDIQHVRHSYMCILRQHDRLLHIKSSTYEDNFLNN